MEQGMLLRNVHRVIIFKQAKFVKSYVDFNTKMLKNAKANKNDFEIDFFKLMATPYMAKRLKMSANILTFDCYRMRKNTKS